MNPGTMVYLGARYSRRGEMLQVAADLEALGAHVTSRWIQGNHQAENDDLSAMARFASEDYADILVADAFIAFTEEPRTLQTNRGGRHVEFGLAYAQGKQMVVVGPLENVFTCLDDVQHFDTWKECLAAAREGRG